MTKNLSQSIWRLIIWITAGLAVILLIGGVILAFFGNKADISIKLFEQELTTTSVGVSLAFIGVVLAGIIFKRILDSLDNAVKIDSTSEDKMIKEKESLEKIIEIISLHRAFHSGDEKIIAEANYFVRATEHMLNMLSYLDAGRAAIVAESFSDSFKQIQDELPNLNTIENGQLKEKLIELVIATKDYKENYGLLEKNAQLAHIGWGQNQIMAYKNNKFKINENDGALRYI